MVGEIITKFVDQGLESLSELNMMKVPLKIISPEMIDDTKEIKNNLIFWKPIKSTVTADDIIEIELKAGLKFSKYFLEFLKYKHFYELDFPATGEVIFYKHPIHKWKDRYLEIYSIDWVQDLILSQGFIPFADHQDWGMLCFDNNRKMDGDEYPIILIDQDTVFDDTMKVVEFADSFIDLIKKITRPIQF